MPLAIVSLNQTLYDKAIANVTCWDNVQEDSAWLQAFADQLRDTANDHWDNHMVLGWTLDDITVSFIDGDHIDYSVPVSFTSGDLQGNVVTDGMPGGAAALISTSFVGGPPNRGRVYFSGGAESGQADGRWDNPMMSDLKEMVEDWAAGYTILGSSTSLQILRRPSAVFSTYVANPVEFVVRTDVTRSQRRRNLAAI